MLKTKLGFAISAATLGMALSQTASADFIGDSKATVGLRNFYFNNDNRSGDADPSYSEEWAQGFMFDYKSGFTEGTVGFGIDALALVGLRLDSGAGRHNGTTVSPDEDGSARHEWSRLGANAKVRFSKTTATYGSALMPKLPILVANDGRLLPQTFEGGMITSNEIDGLTLTGGRLEHAVGRASTNRSGLSVNGGAEDSNEFWFAGGDWKATKDLTAQYYFAKLDEYYKQHFVGLTHVLPLGDKQSFKTDLRYFKTDSTGANSNGTAGHRFAGYTKNNSGEIDNNTWSAAFTYSLAGHAFTLGHQRVSDDSGFAQLNQGSTGEGNGGASVYLLTDRQITAFTRAGENTTFGQYVYDFSSLGVPGLKTTLAYLKGVDGRATNGNRGDEWERDFAVEYVIQNGAAKGLGFAWRNASLRSDVEGQRDIDQNRVIVSYTLSLL
ncbi:OprD family porin [Pseudomonas matsuisoli]|uniref:Porin n=1 Tax=Pseudomonas matsuisoli TaxID=1515666 RepID=A0A917PZQ4_9PSED|nr:OprD family porin [Pseudomonas matsuisoli]GGK03649.1 porin [Pseudomonas matsuisoli]